MRAGMQGAQCARQGQSGLHRSRSVQGGGCEEDSRGAEEARWK